MCELSFSAVANDMQPRGAGLNVQLSQSNSSQRSNSVEKIQQELERDGVIKFGSRPELMKCLEDTGVLIRYPHLRKILEGMAYGLENRSVSSTSLDEARRTSEEVYLREFSIILDVLKKCGKHCPWKRPVKEETVSQNEQPTAPASDSIALDQSETRTVSQS